MVSSAVLSGGWICSEDDLFFFYTALMSVWRCTSNMSSAILTERDEDDMRDCGLVSSSFLYWVHAQRTKLWMKRLGLWMKRLGFFLNNRVTFGWVEIKHCQWLS